MSQLKKRPKFDTNETDDLKNIFKISRNDCKFGANESKFKSSLNSNQEIESTSTEKVPVGINVEKSTESSMSSCNTVRKLWVRSIESMMDKNCLEENHKKPTNNMNNLELPIKLADSSFVNKSVDKTSSAVTVQSHHPVIKIKSVFCIPILKSLPMKDSTTSEVYIEPTTSAVLKKKPVPNSNHKDEGSIVIAGNHQYRLIKVSNAMRALKIGNNTSSSLKCNKNTCPQSALLLCARCGTAKYCSRDCQVKDWFAIHIDNCRRQTMSKKELRNKCHAKNCLNTTQLMCSGCTILKYCSLKCQRNDWYNGHNNYCEKLFALRQEHDNNSKLEYLQN